MPVVPGPVLGDCTFFHKILHLFVHNNIFKKDCTKVLFIISSYIIQHCTKFCTVFLLLLLHKVLFIAQSKVLFQHKVLFIILYNCNILVLSAIFFCILQVFIWILHIFFLLHCTFNTMSKMFCFIAYVLCIALIVTLWHFIICAWAQVSFLHGLCMNSLSTM